MSDPTDVVRQSTYARDGHRCAACASPTSLSFQHRRAVGQGGSKIKPGCADGLTLCIICNVECERSLQNLALTNGWKVRRWADPVKVPIFYPHEFGWYRLAGLSRVRITAVEALDMMNAVYGDEYLRWAGG